MNEGINRRAPNLLDGYHNYVEERCRRVDEYRRKGRISRQIARTLNPKIKEEIKIVEAIESVPAAILSAAQNEGNLVIF